MGIGTESAMLNELRKLVKEQERTNKLLEQLVQVMQGQPRTFTEVSAPVIPWQQP